MRWEKFATFAARNLRLGACLDWHIAPLALRGMGHNPRFQNWVEQQVDFIVVRPFASLDMTATDTKDQNTTTVYAVWFHIEGEERPCSRLRYLDSDGSSTTVQQLIDGLVVWHSECWTSQPDRPPLVIDAIVRHTTKRQAGVKYYRESVEFFLVPDAAQPCK